MLGFSAAPYACYRRRGRYPRLPSAARAASASHARRTCPGASMLTTVPTSLGHAAWPQRSASERASGELSKAAAIQPSTTPERAACSKDPRESFSRCLRFAAGVASTPRKTRLHTTQNSPPACQPNFDSVGSCPHEATKNHDSSSHHGLFRRPWPNAKIK